MADHEQAVIEAALAILRAKLRLPGELVNSLEAARTMEINVKATIIRVVIFKGEEL